MGIILNPRGTSGSGKTELVRRLLAELSCGEPCRIEPIYSAGRRQPIAFTLLHPVRPRPLLVLGRYDGTSGGCDRITVADGGLDEAFRVASRFASAGHDVLLEGLALSHDFGRSAALAHAHPLHILRLDTPIDRCARNLIARQRIGRRRLPLLLESVAAQRRLIEDACERLRYCALIEVVSFDVALLRSRRLLGIPVLSPLPTDA